MSRIDGLSNSNAIHRVVNSLKSQPASAEPAQRPATTDRLEISGASHYLSVLKSQDGVRTDLVSSIRQQIENGTYETDEKLNVAIDRLMQDMGG